VRGTEWFGDPREIRMRLAKLLEEPLQSEEASIWWSRGNSNLQIESFAEEGDCVLINGEEMRISRLAAITSGSYKNSFVFVEVSPSEPTGLYSSTTQSIDAVARGDSPFPFYWEEYGIVDGATLVTRAAFDDGHAMIDGELQSLRGRVEFRARYVTLYNFVIAAAGAPILQMQYDDQLEEHLNAMLRGEDRLSQIADDAKRLPTGHY
jgi:hypothetical protein